jgi:hypothetical protein
VRAVPNLNGGGGARTHGGVSQAGADAGAPAAGGAPASGEAPDASAPDAAAEGGAADDAAGAPPAAGAADSATATGSRTHGGKPSEAKPEDGKPGAGKPINQAARKSLEQIAAKQRELVAAKEEIKTQRADAEKLRAEVETRESKVRPLIAAYEKLKNVHEDPQAALEALDAAGIDPVAFVRAISRAPAKPAGTGKPVDVEAAVKKALSETEAARAKREADEKASKDAAEKKSIEDRQAAEQQVRSDFSTSALAVVESDPEGYPLLSMEDDIGDLCYQVFDDHVRGLAKAGKQAEIGEFVRKLQSGDDSAKMEVFAEAARLAEAALVAEHQARQQKIAPRGTSGRTAPAPGNGLRPSPTLSSKTVPSTSPAPAARGDFKSERQARIDRVKDRLQFNTSPKK